MQDSVRYSTLSNGLTVITLENHKLPLATFWVWYRVGSRNEVTGITGISHWVEHMLFKGTDTLRKGEIFRTVSRNGGILNGFTWIDFTTYFETLPSDRLDLALQIESDRMLNSIFDPNEVENERTVIISEREGEENSPSYLLSEEISAAAFKAHPYGHPVVGWKSDLKAITRDDLYRYYRTYYKPSNAIVVAAGDFQTDALLEKIERMFGSGPAGEPPPVVRAEEPPQYGERRVTLRRPAGNKYIEIAYHAPAASSPDAIGVVVLDAVLSGGKSMGVSGGGARMGRSSRLYRALVSSGLASTAGSSFALTRDPHLFSISASLQDGVELPRVEEVIDREVARLISEPVPAEELERAYKQVRAQFAYGSETVTDQAYWLGSTEVVDSYRLYLDLVTRIEKITPSDLQRIAATYLRPDNRTVGWLIPTERTEEMAEPEPPAVPMHFVPALKPRPAFYRPTDAGAAAAPREIKLKLERQELPNGAVVLGHENHSVPMVALQASLWAGSALDPVGQEGLARFTSLMTLRGTARRTFEQLNLETDSVGASASVDCGRHTVSYVLRSLPEDFDLIVDVLADIIQHPTFPENQMETVRGQLLSGLREEENSTRSQAERKFHELAYPPGHPYHRWPSGNEQIIRSLTRQDLQRFYEEHYRPQGAMIAVVGDIRFAEAVDKLQRAFQSWSKTGPSRQIQVPPVPGPVGIVRQTVVVPGKTQADIALGRPTVSRTDPDFYALNLGNFVLGHLGLYGRLGTDIRDRQGLAYYVYSDLRATLGPSPWVARAGVNPVNVDRAIESIRSEIERIRGEMVSEEELADTKSYLTGVLPLAVESNEGIAEHLLQIEFYGLGLDYLQRYPSIINSVTREQILEACRRYLSAENLVIAVAGPEGLPA